MKAIKENWNIQAFKQTHVFNTDISFDYSQMFIIKKGFIPDNMEDKWFIYFEEDTLYFHRSWTGEAVYKLVFLQSPNSYNATNAYISTKIHQHSPRPHKEYNDEIKSMINNLLLNIETNKNGGKNISLGKLFFSLLHHYFIYSYIFAQPYIYKSW